MSGMPERVLGQYARYANTIGTPQRRLELYLAQIAMLIAQTMGGVKTAKLADFLFEAKDERTDLESLKEQIGFNPVNR